MALHSNTDGKIRNDKEQIAYLEGQVSKFKTALKNVVIAAAHGDSDEARVAGMRKIAVNAMILPQDLVSA